MLINSLGQMEKIVESREDLEWVGWNVVRYFGTSSFLSKDVVFKNGKWTKVKVYPITELGWNVPDSIGGSLAQLER
jgi:hypothetical protein